MASELRVNTLKDASGNNSVATSTIAEGTAKAWVNMNGDNTVAIRTSSNTSSITDNGTGDYSMAFTSSLTDANYVVSGCAMFKQNINAHMLCIGDYNGGNGTTPATTGFRFRTVYNNGGTTDAPQDTQIITPMVTR